MERRFPGVISQVTFGWWVNPRVRRFSLGAKVRAFRLACPFNRQAPRAKRRDCPRAPGTYAECGQIPDVAERARILPCRGKPQLC